MRVHLFIVAFITSSLVNSFGQPPSAIDATLNDAEAVGEDLSPKEKAAKQRLDYMFESCDGYTGVRKSDGAKLKLIPKPLLRWTNPHFGVRDGLFVAWVDDKNRPVAAGQVFLMPRYEDRWYIEQQSLSDSPMSFSSGSNAAWAPEKPGVKWTKFKTDVLKPAKSKPIRLGQMRSLARRFRGENGLTSDNFDLRLLTNPMARYADQENGVLDGALFAMVQGTDPELLVQLEARKDDQGEHEYWWALAAMTSAKLDGYLDDEPVWTKPQNGGSSTDTFYMRQLSGGVPFPKEPAEAAK